MDDKNEFEMALDRARYTLDYFDTEFEGCDELKVSEYAGGMTVDDLRLAIKALEFMARNGEGMVVVPMEPTEEMIEAGARMYCSKDAKGKKTMKGTPLVDLVWPVHSVGMREVYLAMIAAYKPDGDGE